MSSVSSHSEEHNNETEAVADDDEMSSLQTPVEENEKETEISFEEALEFLRLQKIQEAPKNPFQKKGKYY